MVPAVRITCSTIPGSPKSMPQCMWIWPQQMGDGSTGTAYYTYGIANIQDITGTDYADEIYGDSADNIIIGGADDDTIGGGGGTDTLSGGEGEDILYESVDADMTLTDGESATTALLTIDGATSTATGFEGVILEGGDSANRIDTSGYSGSDVTLMGGAGDDTLIAGCR